LTIYSSTGVFDGTGLTIEQNAYYPFGARHSYGGKMADPGSAGGEVLPFISI
jgi:hypothetical protein